MLQRRERGRQIGRLSGYCVIMGIPSCLVLSIALGACTVQTHERSVWNDRAHWGARTRTGAEVVVLESPADVDVTTVELSVRAEAGWCGSS